MCMKWLHTICTDFDSTKNSIWMCRHCRCLPSNVDDLRLQLKEVHELLSRMFDSQNELYSNFCEINTRNFKLQKEVKHLKKVKHKLRMRCYNKLINDDSSKSEQQMMVANRFPVIAKTLIFQPSHQLKERSTNIEKIENHQLKQWETSDNTNPK